MLSLPKTTSRLFSAVMGCKEAAASGKACFSSSAKALSRFYELRTYSIKPECFGDFMELTNENIHLRTSHSKMMGCWTTEYGGSLNEVLHMWQYDNHGHRTAVRAALANDTKFRSSYLSKVLPMLVKQENIVLIPFPWYNVVEKTAVEQGVYELQKHTVMPGKLDQLAHRFQQVAGPRNKYSQILGVWYSELGTLSQVYILLHYRSPDERDKVREETSKDEMWTEAIRDCRSFLLGMESKLLVPTKFSPWR